MRTLHAAGYQAIGLDVNHSAFTHRVGSVADRGFVKKCMPGVQAVLHTATLHKPHIATHTRQGFVDTNVTGTLNMLEEATDRSGRLHLHEHDERIREGTRPKGWGASRLDHRGCRAVTEEHLRCH